jgi:hypothetical protein
MFGDSYIKKNGLSAIIEEVPDPSVEMIVVIPSIKEPNIIKTLESLIKSTSPTCKAEVIIFINHSEDAPEETKYFNQQTRAELDKWIKINCPPFMTIYPIGPVSLPRKWAGAGLARKRGMDEAMRRFNYLNKPKGIIVSLDADAVVHEKYFCEIEKYFLENPNIIGTTIFFEHQTDGLSKKQFEGIRLYEQYMYYYKEALKYTGYPYAMYTVGSAFAVTANAYVKRGGMNRRKAGEEFYFLQELAQQGKIGEITSKLVFPSARISERAPFGTGQMMKRWMEGTEDLSLTYDLSAFQDLRLFINQITLLYKINEKDFQSFCTKLPKPVMEFLINDNFWYALKNLNDNCSNLEIFKLRFFHIFNAFKVLKYLNFVHGTFFQKSDLSDQTIKLKQLI